MARPWLVHCLAMAEPWVLTLTANARSASRKADGMPQRPTRSEHLDRASLVESRSHVGRRGWVRIAHNGVHETDHRFVCQLPMHILTNNEVMHGDGTDAARVNHRLA